LDRKSGLKSARRGQQSRRLMMSKDKTSLLRRNTIRRRPNATQAISLK
jgi:hypothetical protein